MFGAKKKSRGYSMRRIKTVSNVVEKILTEMPFTRASDDALYFEVCIKFNPICEGLKFGETFNHINEMQLPKYESVSRVRRKIQAEHPELRPSKEVEDERFESFKAVLDYV